MKPRTERPRTKPVHAPAAKPPAKTRRAKPVFEIPLETTQPAAAEWVYRTEPAPAALSHINAPHIKAPHTKIQAHESPNIILVAGVRMFVAGIAAVGLVSLAAIGMVSAPVMLFRGIVRRTARDA